MARMLARGTSGPISPQAMIPPSRVPQASNVRRTSSLTSAGEPKGKTRCRSMSVRKAILPRTLRATQS